MRDILVGIGLMAVLFVLSGIFRHRGCTGHCAGCTGACGRYQEGDGHDR
ncbi:MAG TPA: hypothetical protein VLB00_16700 [Gemmatimonadales bacterium]|nr:hypothetical protein [Gemmatimonadales bacterium]